MSMCNPRCLLLHTAKRHHQIAGRKCEVKKALSKQEMDKAKQQAEMREMRSGGYGKLHY